MTQQEFFERYKYNVETDHIGDGGFGTVYRATDRLLHREVAVKVSPVKYSGGKEFSLKAEFDAVGNLPPHPNIAHYEELCQFKTPYGIFDYAVMQYYKDGNLKQLLESRKLTYSQKEKLAAGILDGIAFLHRNKVVHRDLKPANILICREGDDYVPLITDFGLSKGVEEMSKSGFSNSIAGGSPGYMSPEQIKGGRMHLNTDLWSYGVMVYELFSGRRLFRSASPTGSTAEVNDMILRKDISAEIAALPGKWRMVAEWCLMRDNRLRAKSAEELYGIINVGVDDEVTVVDDPTPTPQPKPQRNLTWLWVLLGVLVFGGVVFRVIRGIENKRERERIAAEQQAAADNAFFQNCKDVTDYRSYLNKYPDGLNAELAKNKIGRHVTDSTAKAQEAERQRQIAAENERKAQEAERQRQMAAEAERKALEAERQRQIAAENERKAQEAERQRQIAAENERKAREKAEHFKDKTFTVNGVSFEMVAVNGGTFTMGATSEQGSDVDSDEKPTHSVTLGDYYMGKFEVTQELWEAVMGSNPSFFKGSNLPVEMVNWYAAVEFCNRLSEKTGRSPYYSIDKGRRDPDNESKYDDLKWTVRVNPGANGFRLPTEAEWEYAARGGNRSRGYKYSGSNNISDVAWYWENSGDRVLSGECDYDKIINNNLRTHPVGMKSPNELGIYDMSGNVGEWCQDWYESYGGGSQTNPLGPSRVERGGSWNRYAGCCRVSRRLSYTPDIGGNDGGFRLVLVP